MTDFVSKMPMHSQDTPNVVLDAERRIVAHELNLDDEAATERLSFSDEGWSSRVYLVDDGEIIYKFPRSPEVTADYQREIAALVLLEATATPLPVQRYRQSGRSRPYLSMYGLVGVQLSEQLASLTDDTKTVIGRRIGGFLGYLHGLELPDAPVVTPKDEVLEWQEKYRLATPALERNLSRREQAAAAEFFMDELPEQVNRLGMERRLCHGDLGSYNIILGSDGTPGIIDFGNIGYYDQSRDFIDFGDDTVLAGALEGYGRAERLEEKIAVRTIALQAIDLVYYMSKKDNHGVAQTAATLRSMLAEKDSSRAM